eukprot:COSAG02_NODE_1537_length_12050_cov_219.008116_10_plen_79_part_00
MAPQSHDCRQTLYYVLEGYLMQSCGRPQNPLLSYYGRNHWESQSGEAAPLEGQRSGGPEGEAVPITSTGTSVILPYGV